MTHEDLQREIEEMTLDEYDKARPEIKKALRASQQAEPAPSIPPAAPIVRIGSARTVESREDTLAEIEAMSLDEYEKARPRLLKLMRQGLLR
jgi:hypothetical protein